MQVNSDFLVVNALNWRCEQYSFISQPWTVTTVFSMYVDYLQHLHMVSLFVLKIISVCFLVLIYLFFFIIYTILECFFIDYRWMLLCLLYILDHVCFPILILQVRNIIFKINRGTCIIFPTETFYNLNVKWSHKIKDRQRLVSIANTVNTNTLKT